MRKIIFIALTGILLSLFSCREDFSFEPSTGQLEFSKQTVYLDTVFKNIGSSTYRLKVYNRSNKDIAIPVIQLGKGLNSKYRITVDGMRGNNNKIFNNVELLAKDSLFIFIETTADVTDANPDDFLYTDHIQFDTGEKLQKVELVTLVKDAYFIYPKRTDNVYETVPVAINEDNTIAMIKGRDLVENHPENGNEFIWTSQKPYVVYGYASVPANKTLVVDAGARIHFHANSGLIVQENGTLNIIGSSSATADLENEVIFEGDRLEPFFDNVPGQWGAIYLRQGSKNHTINHLTLKNASVGLLIDNNVGTATITNTQIYDCSNAGIYAQSAKIEGYNIVINAAGQAALACTLGGNYNFRHCTFNNNWPSTKQVAVLVDNYFINNSNIPVAFDLTEATFSNCIIYGSNQVEMLLNKNSTKLFNYQFNNCLIKFQNDRLANDPLYDFSSARYSQCLIAKSGTPFNPKFLNVGKNKLNINNTSAAFEKGNPIYLVPKDILGFPRNTTVPDIGAYTNKPFPD